MKRTINHFRVQCFPGNSASFSSWTVGRDSTSHLESNLVIFFSPKKLILRFIDLELLKATIYSKRPILLAPFYFLSVACDMSLKSRVFFTPSLREETKCLNGCTPHRQALSSTKVRKWGIDCATVRR